MGLTPQDVHERQFRMVRQTTGYDIDEVDSFLEEVEAELRRLHQQLDEARGAGAGGGSVTSNGSVTGNGSGNGSGPDAGAPQSTADDGSAAQPGSSSDSAGGADPGSAGASRGSLVEAPATAAARILELAQRTADEYLSEAQRQAERIRTDAAGLETRVAELRVYESELRGRLRGYFHTELEQLRKVLGDD